MQLRSKLLSLTALAMLVAAFGSSALTLGRVRGAAIIGRALDVSIPVQLDGDETASNLCIEADVFHSDTKVEPGRLRVSVEQAQGSQTANVRVLSSAFVDEPVVTIYLKAGCGQKSTRRYVLLADFPSDTAAAPTPSVLPVVVTTQAAGSDAPASTAPSSPTVSAAEGQAGAASSNASTGNSNAGSFPPKAAAQPEAPAVKAAPRKAPEPTVAAAKPVPPKPVAPPKPAAKPADKPADKPAPPAKEPNDKKIDEKLAAGRSAGQSRLKLDPLVTLAERVATLEQSSSVPVAEVMRDAERVQSLEGSVKALVALATKNEANLLDMKLRLQKAEAERFPMEWLYGLAALVLACLAGMAYLWSRLQKRQQPESRDDWWSPSKRASLEALQSPPGASGRSPLNSAEAEPGADFAHSATQKISVAERSRAMGMRDDPASEMDVSLVEMSESNFDNLMQSGQSHSALRKGPLAAPAPNPRTQIQPLDVKRSINSVQLFDLRQQAAFYVSLGQTDQAVRVLESHINDHGESSPLIYLDLLQIFHSLGLRADYLQFREDFNLLFNSKVPEFSSFRDEGKGLEAYPHLLAHLTALWGTPKAQMVIEGSVFRDPLDDKSAPFDLAAFRDLLLLHAVAQSASQPDAGLSAPMPLGGMDGAGPAQERRSGVSRSEQTISVRFGGVKSPPPSSGAPAELDLDFSDFDAATQSPPEEVALPASGKTAGALAGKPAAGQAAGTPLDMGDFPVIVSPGPVEPAKPAAAPAQPTNAGASAPGGNAAHALSDGNLLDFNLSEPGSLPLPKPKR